MSEAAADAKRTARWGLVSDRMPNGLVGHPRIVEIDPSGDPDLYVSVMPPEPPPPSFFERRLAGPLFLLAPFAIALAILAICS